MNQSDFIRFEKSIRSTCTNQTQRAQVDVNTINDRPRLSIHMSLETIFDQNIFEEDTKRQEMEWSSLLIEEQETVFQYSVCFKFILYNILFFFVTGPLTGYIFQIFTGKYIMINQFFHHRHRQFYYQVGLYVATVTLFTSYFFTSMIKLSYMGIIMITTQTILRICMIGARYGTIHPARLKKLYNEELPIQEITSDYLLRDWKEQNDFAINKEILHSILRNDIDLSLFYFEFLTPFDSNELQQKTIQYFHENQSQCSLIQQNFPSKYNTYKILQSMLLKQTPYRHKIFGISICQDFIQRRALSKSKHLATIISLILGITKSFIPVIVRYLQGQPPLGSNIEQHIIITLSISLNSVLNVSCTQILVQAVCDMILKSYLMKQLTNLISPLKTQEYPSEKIYPTINFFDKISVKAWRDLRNIFFDYGTRYFIRHNVNITIYLIYHILLSVYISLQYFGVVEFKFSQILSFVCVYELLTTFCILALMMYFGAVINDHFNVHVHIIDRIKYLVYNLLHFSNDYFGNSTFETTNLYLRYGIVKVKEIVGEDATVEDIKLYLRGLYKMLNQITESIKTGEKSRPFKILGLPINYTTIGSILAGLGSILATNLQKIISAGYK